MEEMKRNGLSKTFAVKALIAAGGGTALLFLFYSLIGIADVWRWAYGVRHLLTGILVLFLAQLGTGRLMTHRTWRLPLFLFFAYSAAFPLFQILANDTSRITMEYPSRYFQVGLAAAVVIYFLRWYGEETKLQTVSRAAAWLLFAVASLNLFAYVSYGYFYGTVFSLMDMIAILTAPPSQSGEFLMTFGIGRIACAVSLYVGWLLICGWFSRGGHEIKMSVRAWQKALQGIVCIGMLLMLTNWGGRTFPVYEYKKAREYLSGMEELVKNHQESVKQFHIDDADRSLASSLPGTVIAVIGETEGRDHMTAFTPAHAGETTPWLSGVGEEDGFYLYPKTYANYPITIKSLSMALTNVNQYNGKKPEDIVTITDVANEAGYDTWWISNHIQEPTTPSLLANASAHSIWIAPPMGDDHQLLDVLKEIPKGGNHFIVIHLYGSHAKYRARVPDAFPRVSLKENTDTENDYDTTVLYTDKMLQEIFEYASAHLNLQAMTYTSDHGEDMEYQHNASRFTFTMVRVPFFVYLSPAYRAAYPEKAAALAAHREKVFTNDLMFDTVCGLLRAPNPEYGAEYDISRAEYALTPEAARTMHGEVRVTEDPKF